MESQSVVREGLLCRAPKLSYKDKVDFNGYSTTVTSELAVNIVLDKIRESLSPLAKVPYALRMTIPGDDSTDEIVEYYDDDDEFGAGDILMTALTRANLDNAIVIVTVMPRRAFSTDFIPVEIIRYLREASMNAVELLRIKNEDEISKALQLSLHENESDIKQNHRQDNTSSGTDKDDGAPQFIRLVNEEDGM
jgi:hypothetical protein